MIYILQNRTTLGPMETEYITVGAFTTPDELIKSVREVNLDQRYFEVWSYAANVLIHPSQVVPKENLRDFINDHTGESFGQLKLVEPKNVVTSMVPPRGGEFGR